MKKYLILFITSITLLFSTFAFANGNGNSSGNANTDTDSTLVLSKYYQATCKAMTGTWYGFYTDPGDLFDNGGPWRINVSLFYQKGRIVGKATNLPPTHNVNIWAQCKKGTLKNIFMGKRGQCGEYSLGGVLVSKNVLVLSLHYESAMTGTNFLVFLKRLNNSYPYSIPNRAAFYPGKIRTCH